MIFLFLIYFCLQASAQKIREVSASAQMRVEETMTEIQAKAKTVEMARINAIREAFGEVVTQGNSMYIRNIESGDSVKTENVFNMIADTYVNGEWLEDTKEPVYTINRQNGETWLEVRLTCRVRELPTSRTYFEAQTLSCPELKCKTDVFNQGQDFYLHFISPLDGFISVYLDVPSEKRVYRLLPYKAENSATCSPVKSDTPYILFSDKHNKMAGVKGVDGLTMDLSDGRISELNTVVVIFSPTMLTDKPILSGVDSSNRSAPLNTSASEFYKWLLKVRKKSPDLLVNKYNVTINP